MTNIKKYRKYIISIIIILFISYVAFFVIPDFTKGFQQGWTEKMIKMDKEKLNHKQK